MTTEEAKKIALRRSRGVLQDWCDMCLDNVLEELPDAERLQVHGEMKKIINGLKTRLERVK